MALNKAIVKSVLSGDTVILRGRPRPGTIPPERQLSLEKLTAPRVGRRDTDDEPFAFESREFLRRQLVGKEVSFQVTYTTQGGREYGRIFVGTETEPINTACRIRDDDSEEAAAAVTQLIALEEEAKSNNVGVWADTPRSARQVHQQLSGDARTFLEQHRGKSIDAIVEQVRDGSTLRVQLIYPGDSPNSWIHQYVVLLLSGIKAPVVRTGIQNTPDVVEPFGEEAKFFVESRLLQREVKIKLEGTNNQNLIGSVLHPAGNIAEALVAQGLARVVDWSIALCSNGPATLRAAEKAAKEKRLRLWKDYVPKAKAAGSSFNGIVSRVASGDTLHILPSGGLQERKVRLAGVRQPRSTDDKEAGYLIEAKELLRKRFIGKPVHVTIDYIQPAQDNFEERECATVKYNNINVAELLVSRGLAGIIRYRKDDDNRASTYDQLLIAEDTATKAGKGIHSGKPKAAPRYTDASENNARANSHISAFKRAGKVSAVVEHVSNAARFRLLLPKDNCKLTLVLGGVSAPRVARNPSEKSESFAQEALEFTTRKCLQRDVEVEFESIDKSGGFIGTLWLNEQGLAKIHGYSADQSVYTNQLYAAERHAKEAQLNLWDGYDEKREIAQAEEYAAATAETSIPTKTEELRVVVTDIGDAGVLAVQVIGDGVQALEELMSRLSVHQQKAGIPAQPYRPKNNELCSARFTEDNQWYRARVRRHVDGGKSLEVVYIDYGNSEVIPLERVRPLATEFSKLPAQSKEAVFAFLKVPARSSDYGSEVYNAMRDLVENAELIAVVEARQGTVLHCTFYNAKLAADKRRHENSLNAELLRLGFASLDKRAAYAKNRASAVATLQVVQDSARRGHRGMWEYGDIPDEDDEY
ncbi:transcription factor [Syncephalis fuscata]|nr:transcription factor [Syncephalis fuscata]